MSSDSKGIMLTFTTGYLKKSSRKMSLQFNVRVCDGDFRAAGNEEPQKVGPRATITSDNCLVRFKTQSEIRQIRGIVSMLLIDPLLDPTLQPTEPTHIDGKTLKVWPAGISTTTSESWFLMDSAGKLAYRGLSD